MTALTQHALARDFRRAREISANTALMDVNFCGSIHSSESGSVDDWTAGADLAVADGRACRREFSKIEKVLRLSGCWPAGSCMQAENRATVRSTSRNYIANISISFQQFKQA